MRRSRKRFSFPSGIVRSKERRVGLTTIAINASKTNGFITMTQKIFMARR
jgi:hypothetical protein